MNAKGTTEKKVGVIGTGRLGSMLIRGFLDRQVFLPGQLIINNRSRQKLQELKNGYPDIRIAINNNEVLLEANWIFLCVKPMDFSGVLPELGRVFSGDKIIISTLLSPPLRELDRIFSGKIVRIYPSITQSTGRGVTLAAFGRNVSDGEKRELLHCLRFLGKVYELPEEAFRHYGDITSCGPAFMAYMVGCLAETAKGYSIVDEKLAAEMALETMFGTAQLMKDRNISFRELVGEVATPGGCTNEGISVLANTLPDVVRTIFQVTEAKEKEIGRAVMDSIKKQSG